MHAKMHRDDDQVHGKEIYILGPSLDTRVVLLFDFRVEEGAEYVDGW